MTTNRTAIRRWLAVGGRPHRPPRRARKARHRPILAPLAVTLATTAAIGFGVALARAEVERRAERGRPKARGLGLDAGEALGPGLQRMTVEQADFVVEQLAAAEDGNAHRAVHEARKAIKRLRTILRLLEGELGSATCTREQEALRAAAGLLAAARDAEVMGNTLEALVRRHPKRLAGEAVVLTLRQALARDRETAEQRVLEPGNRLRVSDELRQFRARAERWQLAGGPDLLVAEKGLHRLYRQGRRRFRRAAGKHGGRIHPMHQWRKRVKDLRYALEALQRSPLSRTAIPSARKARTRTAAEAKWLSRLVKRADSLGEVLGEEHDLAVLGQWIAARGAVAGADRATLRRLQKLIALRRRKLRRRALREGRELYRRSPGRFIRRVGAAYARSSPALSRR